MASTTQRPGTLSRWTARFLRVSLLPVILVGVPAWPVLALLCVVPLLSLLTIPLFVALSAVLVYSLSWFTYLVLAQADAPSSGSALVRVLPFLPYSPLKCLKVTWASFLYSSVALRLAFPAILDWSYRRVVVLGTAAGAAVVKEGILYGDPAAGKRLDVYIPPAATSAANRKGQTPDVHIPLGKRHRKHSTLFDEPPPAVGPDGDPIQDGEDALDGAPTPRRTQRGAAVIVFLPSTIPPIAWTSNRKTYLQLALRLRRMGHCVVVPDVSYFPESRIRESIIDVRLVLRWVGEEISRYGGDPERIHLMGHGLSAHLALLTLTQEAVVLSREGILEAQAHRDAQKAHSEERWQREEEERQRYAARAAAAAAVGGEAPSSPPRKVKVAGQPTGLEPSATLRLSGHSAEPDNAWVDEPATVDEESTAQGPNSLAPGIVLPSVSAPRARRGRGLGDEGADGANRHHTHDSFQTAQRLAKQLDALSEERPEPGLPVSPSGRSAAAESRASHAISFPATPGTSGARQQRYLVRRRLGLTDDSDDDDLLDVPIPNGLRRVEIYEPEIDVPAVAGLILFSGVSDVIKGFRNETERGVEDLSVLRRSCGPSHTGCLLHSPAHLLYAAKNLIDPSLLPPKVLLVHGGQDAVVPIEQSTLLKTLLVGIGVTHVRLRAYRKLGHVESVACLFLGMNKGLKRYMKMICQDLDDFLAS
ncbi:unnamed protein product [Parajaminaea phylloscopi]